ncbi:zinc-dependent alcohol dehydrogenase family protein [uncultured Microbacterium sp.]|uniref:zinc-dependent alcohol dehydrogenase family protein n=1 Tax=uncultured Microbacterium sp. TaxID=191216 RepID=UPI0028D24838|nr:zinc-dependent alcohol dehydrogenase family protein [uncultured Microbacterium sp.]
MQAISYDAYRSTPALVEVDEPVCADDGVVIEVRATGVCRSDWHAWQGHDPVALPQIPGHEFAGVVVAVGSDVTSCTIGDRVTVPFVCGCGRCAWCLAGDGQICPDQEQPGFTMPGSFAQLVAIPAADFNVVHLPDDIDFVAAASLGCRFATAYRAITVHGRVQSGDWVAVHGCGGVGLSAVMIAAALGARVIAVDRSHAALARARELGAEVTLDADDDPAGRIRAVTGDGAAVSLDAVGSPPAAVASIWSLRPRGRHVQIGLLLGDDADVALPMGRIIANELEIYGSHGMAARDYAGMLHLVASGALRPDRLVGEVIGLADAGAALAAMSAPSPGHGVTVVELPSRNGAEGTAHP